MPTSYLLSNFNSLVFLPIWFFMRMKRLSIFLFLLVATLLPGGAFGSDTLYKSIDEAGRVTYSSQPPPAAVEIEEVQVAPGPSAEVTEKAAARVKETAKKVDAHYRELMERREQEAAERERIARETAERQKRIEESLDQPAMAVPYYWPYPLRWWGPRPPYRPMTPPYAPRPMPSTQGPNRSYEGHINSPLWRGETIP
jgi:hypothetical protein